MKVKKYQNPAGSIELPPAVATASRRTTFDNDYDVVTPWDHYDRKQRWMRSDEYDSRWNSWINLSNQVDQMWNNARRASVNDLKEWLKVNYANLYNEFSGLDDNLGNTAVDLAISGRLSDDDMMRILEKEGELIHAILNNSNYNALEQEAELQRNNLDNIPESFDDTLRNNPLFKPYYDTLDYVNELYGTRRAKRHIRRADRYAQRISGNKLSSFRDLDTVQLGSLSDPFLAALANEHFTLTDSSYNQSEKRIKLGIDDDPNYPGYVSPEVVTAHEAAHTRIPYNYNPNYDPDSNIGVYDDDTSVIRKKYRKWLTPSKATSEHDSYLSENYSDLMGLRAAMNALGINDGIRERYRNKDVRKARELMGTIRYLDLHDNDRLVRKALNRIWQNGGKLKWK